jgi:hypothetical protein
VLGLEDDGFRVKVCRSVCGNTSSMRGEVTYGW